MSNENPLKQKYGDAGPEILASLGRTNWDGLTEANIDNILTVYKAAPFPDIRLGGGRRVKFLKPNGEAWTLPETKVTNVRYVVYCNLCDMKWAYVGINGLLGDTGNVRIRWCAHSRSIRDLNGAIGKHFFEHHLSIHEEAVVKKFQSYDLAKNLRFGLFKHPDNISDEELKKEESDMYNALKEEGFIMININEL